MKYCSRPLRGIYISIQNFTIAYLNDIKEFSSPTGYLHFYSKRKEVIRNAKTSSRPLRGIYISILSQSPTIRNNGMGSRPLRGIYISILFHFIIIISCFNSSRPLRGIYISIRAKPQFTKPNIRFSSPTGYLHFYSFKTKTNIYVSNMFSSPTGYLHFYSEFTLDGKRKEDNSSRPLRGIYISIQRYDKIIYIR